MGAEYTPSINSESTTYSYTKTEDDSQKQRRSMRQRVKAVLSDVGNPPTMRHDAENGRKSNEYNGFTNVLNRPQRL